MKYEEALEVLSHHKPDMRYTMLIEALEELKRLAAIGEEKEKADKIER